METNTLIMSIQNTTTRYADRILGESGGSPWAAAVALFGVGDITTTLVGFSVGAVEKGPVPAALMGESAVSVRAALALVVLKLAAFGVCWLMWRFFPTHVFGLSDRWRGVIPASVAAFGLFIVLYNTRIILLSV